MSDTQSFWDAGDLGCGELLMQLKKKLALLAPGSEFKLIASDPGAIEDIPAWVNLTGNILISSNHPEYIIVAKFK